MKRVIIIGAGFAGLSASYKLSRSNLGLDITLFDKKDYFDFLPLIPDILGRKLSPEFLQGNIKEFSQRRKINFIKKEIVSVDLASKQVTTSASSYAYDFLVIASGSQSNFFNNQDAQNYAYGLNSVKDAQKISAVLQQDKFDNFIICGGGYTGVEAATNLWLYFKKNNLLKKITIVELAPGILGPLPDWMKVYVQSNLKSMGINILVNTVIERIQEAEVTVSSGDVFQKAMLIWVPGVRTADFIQQMSVPKNPQGRIVVDEYLGFKPDCFCAGDTAFFTVKNNSLRMAIQFAISEGAQAADNIIRSIKSLPLKRFQPLDLGYIIPMANNSSCGRVLGLNVRGRLATFLHYIMCIYRS